MPSACQHCTATNAPYSDFWHRCGAILSCRYGDPTQSTSSAEHPTLGAAAVDFKPLAVDAARYAGPRVGVGAIFSARVTQRFATPAASGLGSKSAPIAQRSKRPNASPDGSVTG